MNDEEQDKNHLMNFVLQLESVADEDDKTQIERLWGEKLNLISMLKDSEIDSNDTDSENEDDTDSVKENEEEDEDEDEDNFVWLDKNKNRIKTDVKRASHTHHVPHVGFPQIDPVTKAISVKLAPIGALHLDNISAKGCLHTRAKTLIIVMER